MICGGAPLPPPRIIGHRGAAARAPENTLAGFRAAKAAGARWVEFDVQVTRDDCPILLHDARLERTTDGHGLAVDRTAAEIARLDAGAWFGRAFRGEPVPQLADAMTLVQELGLGAVIEIKAAPGAGARTMRASLAVLTRCRAEHDIMVASFDEAALSVAAAEAPGVARVLNVRSVPRDWQQRVERLACAALHAEQRALKRATAAAIAAVLPLRAFTVNAPGRANTLFSWGVAAVFTDCPDVLVSAFGHGSARPAEAGCTGEQ